MININTLEKKEIFETVIFVQILKLSRYLISILKTCNKLSSPSKFYI